MKHKSKTLFYLSIVACAFLLFCLWYASKQQAYDTYESGKSKILYTAEEEAENFVVNINTADIDEIAELPNIGESIAERIIAYRNENGGFKSVDEIKNVSGIGDKTYEEIKNSISID